MAQLNAGAIRCTEQPPVAILAGEVVPALLGGAGGSLSRSMHVPQVLQQKGGLAGYRFMLDGGGYRAHTRHTSRPDGNLEREAVNDLSMSDHRCRRHW